MPGFSEFYNHEKHGTPFASLSPADNAHLDNISQALDDSVHEAQQRTANVDYEQQRYAYMAAIDRRESTINAYVANPTVLAATALRHCEEVTLAYFRSYIDSLLRAPAGVFDLTAAITNALGLADLSQMKINAPGQERLRFHPETLEQRVMGIIMEFDGEGTRQAITAIYEAHMRDVALGYAERQVKR